MSLGFYLLNNISRMPAQDFIVSEQDDLVIVTSPISRTFTEDELNHIEKLERKLASERKKRKIVEQKAKALANMKSISDRALDDYKDAYSRCYKEKTEAIEKAKEFEVKTKQKFNKLLKMEEAHYLRQFASEENEI